VFRDAPRQVGALIQQRACDTGSSATRGARHGEMVWARHDVGLMNDLLLSNDADWMVVCAQVDGLMLLLVKTCSSSSLVARGLFRSCKARGRSCCAFVSATSHYFFFLLLLGLAVLSLASRDCASCVVCYRQGRETVNISHQFHRNRCVTSNTTVLKNGRKTTF